MTDQEAWAKWAVENALNPDGKYFSSGLAMKAYLDGRREAMAEVGNVNHELLAACEHALEANRKGNEPAEWAVKRLESAIANAKQLHPSKE